MILPIPFVGALVIYLLFNEDDTMPNKWWIIAKKQEMTRLRIDGKQVPVTLLKLVPQEILRQKTSGKDGYSAYVLWVEKKIGKDKKTHYKMICEFKVDDSLLETYTSWSELDASFLEDVKEVSVSGVSKGKWFQWVMKRHNFAWGPASHGSKFHRAGWSTGMRKPRRTIRWWKMAGRMWWDKITLRSVAIVDIWKYDGNVFVAMKGSIPGAYNSYVKLLLK